MALQDYLVLLEASEIEKPPSQRREVPSLVELATITNMSRQGMYHFSSDEVRRVNLDTLAAVINELRRRGFEVEVGDLLREYPAGEG